MGLSDAQDQYIIEKSEDKKQQDYSIRTISFSGK